MSWLDHFDTLDTTRWGTIVNGTGSVGVTDSMLELACPANNDCAAVYLKTPVVIGTPQMFAICLKSDAAALTQLPQWVTFVDTAGAPSHTTTALNDTRSRLRYSQVNGNAVNVAHWQAAHARKESDSAGAWGAPTQVSLANGRLDDFHIVIVEFDGTRFRFHLQSKGYTTAGVWEFDQGFRTFLITDWITNATLEAIANSLWLCIGHLINNAGAHTGTIRVEWVRYADGPATHLYANSRDSGAGWVVKHFYALDGKMFVGEDRSTNHIGLGTAGQWDDNNVKPGAVIKDGATYYSFYAGVQTGSGKSQIGYATKSTPDGAFTRYASNPIIARQAGTHRDQVGVPYVVKDEADSDANKRWKMVYLGFSSIDSKWRLYYATAPAPDQAWTDQGLILGPGSAGSVDEFGCSNPVLLHYGGQWVLYYGANATGTAAGWSTCRATGTSLLALTKDPLNPIIPRLADATEVITANISGRTASMASTTGFVKDMPVVIDQDTTTDNWTMDRVRKVNTNTSLELYHAITGFTTATPAKVFGLHSGSNSPAEILQVGNEWFFYVTPFQIPAPTATYNGYCETTGLLRASTALPAPSDLAWDWPASPPIPQNQYAGMRSVENPVAARLPLTAYTSAPGMRVLFHGARRLL
jgi:hypothetical protein